MKIVLKNDIHFCKEAYYQHLSALCINLLVWLLLVIVIHFIRLTDYQKTFLQL